LDFGVLSDRCLWFIDKNAIQTKPTILSHIK
jgi:hypothetical protein